MILRMMPGGDTIDFDSLTADPADVVAGRVFVGEGSEEEQTGTLPDRAEMHGAPGLDNSHPNIPVHQSVDIKTKTDTNGDIQIALAPPLGKYPGGTSAYVGCYPAEIGIEPEKIKNGETAGGVTGTYGSDSTATGEDVRDGKVYYDKDGRKIGNAGNYAAAAASLNCGESYTIPKGFHQQGTVRANSLGSQTQPQGTDANASNAQILKGYGAWSNGAYRSGTMKNISGDATIKHTSSDNSPVVVGDACYQTKNSDNTDRFEIRYNGDPGYISKPTFFAIGLDKLRTALGIVAGVIKNGTTIAGLSGTYGADATAEAGHILSGKSAYGKNGKITGTLANRGQYQYGEMGEGGDYYAFNALPEGAYFSNGASWAPEARCAKSTVRSYLGITASKVAKGESIAGVTGTWYGNKKAIGVSAYDARGSSESYNEQSFTMPANGIVYYGGSTGGWYYTDADSWSTCAIYKNGVLMDNRNIANGANLFRGSMFNQSFSASAGDTIKVVAQCSKGSRGDFMMSCIQAVIVY